ncbi:MAG: hypothetical protein ACKV2T_24685, partial [Kofleriaceae bacterium]
SLETLRECQDIHSKAEQKNQFIRTLIDPSTGHAHRVLRWVSRLSPLTDTDRPSTLACQDLADEGEQVFGAGEIAARTTLKVLNPAEQRCVVRAGAARHADHESSGARIKGQRFRLWLYLALLRLVHGAVADHAAYKAAAARLLVPMSLANPPREILKRLSNLALPRVRHRPPRR